MVTAFGLLLAPTLLPLLALLSIKRLNSRGVFAGFAAGLLSGIVSLLVRQALSSHGGSFDARLQGFSIIASTITTCAAMLIASRLFPEGDAERKRAELFFHKLDTPVEMTGSRQEKSSVRNSIIAGATTAVGALLIAAGFLAQAKIARGIDLSLGVALSVTGSIQWKRSRRENTPPSKPILEEEMGIENAWRRQGP